MSTCNYKSGLGIGYKDRIQMPGQTSKRKCANIYLTTCSQQISCKHTENK